MKVLFSEFFSKIVVLILQKEDHDRTRTDLDFLVKCTENVTFFKKYDRETHRQCMTKMYHVHLKEGDVCMNFGEAFIPVFLVIKRIY